MIMMNIKTQIISVEVAMLDCGHALASGLDPVGFTSVF